METRFTWDPEKARTNLRDHGISFQTAIKIFGDPHIVDQENITDESEQRRHVIGMTESLVLLIVVFVDRSEPEIEIIHIISARKVDSYERRAYEDQFR